VISGLPEGVLQAILAKGKLYLVGGSLRDWLIHPDIEPKDADLLVTGIPLEDLTRTLEPFGRVDVVGRSFGVLKFSPHPSDLIPQPATLDISLPRKEASTGVGHKDFTVDYDHNLPVEADLGRRDFTINAMAYPITGKTGDGRRKTINETALIDPYHGREDLKDKLIRIVNPTAFEEDPLRMLRAVQFAARFEFAIEEGTFRAMKRDSRLIATVSPERVQEELAKLLTKADKPSIGLFLMQRSGLMKEALPELEEGVGTDQPGGYHAHDVFKHTLMAVDASPKALIPRLAALFHDIAKPRTREVYDGGATFYGHDKMGAEITEGALSRLKYSNEVVDRVVRLVSAHMFQAPETEKGLRRLIRKVGEDQIFTLLDLRRADIVAQGKGGSSKDVDEFEKIIREEMAKKPPLSTRDLAINGDDIMSEFGLAPGPLVGRVLNHLLEAVLDEPGLNQRETLIRLARQFLETQGKR
jgi:tRNA nucleotidyltransferase (CCA-adding enzyme)